MLDDLPFDRVLDLLLRYARNWIIASLELGRARLLGLDNEARYLATVTTRDVLDLESLLFGGLRLKMNRILSCLTWIGFTRMDDKLVGCKLKLLIFCLLRDNRLELRRV